VAAGGEDSPFPGWWNSWGPLFGAVWRRVAGLRPWFWPGWLEGTRGDHWPPLVPFQECTDGYEWDPDSQHCRGECAWGTYHPQQRRRDYCFPNTPPPPRTAEEAQWPQANSCSLGGPLAQLRMAPPSSRRKPCLYLPVGKRATGHCSEKPACIHLSLNYSPSPTLYPLATW
jgi:hypothetical protein